MSRQLSYRTFVGAARALTGRGFVLAALLLLVSSCNPNQNQPPKADAGPEQTVARGSTVQLDGSRSSDADGDALVFSWQLLGSPDGSFAQLSDANSVRPTFVADRPGIYAFRLIVSDPLGKTSEPDTVIVSTAQSLPVAHAGSDQTPALNSTVTLDGSASSDVDGSPLSYEWSFVSKPAGSAALLSGATEIQPTFVVDLAGAYVVQLIVNDGTSNSAPDQVSINTINSAPVANAGLDQSASAGSTVTLDGSASTDVDGNPITYRWSLTTRPAGSTSVLSNPTAIHPSFSADRPGVYVAQLIVNDGLIDSEPDTLIVSSVNVPPLANAGLDQGTAVGAAVFLDGRASTDANGHALIFRWALLNRPAGSLALLTDSATSTPSFIADLAGSYTAQLIVNDGLVDSAPDQVMITTGNTRPVASAGPDQTPDIGDSVTLDGAASTDADGDALSFVWSLLTRPQNSLAVLVGAGTARPMLTTDQAGEYVAQLIVSDGELDSAPDTVLLTVGDAAANQAPEITSIPPNMAVVGAPYGYAVQAVDPDGDTLTYSLVLAPPGMIINSSTGFIQWTPTNSTTATVSFQVADPDGATDSQTWMIFLSGTTVPVPDVVGKSRAEAESAIVNAGFSVGAIAKQNDAGVAAGRIISQTPAAGTGTARGQSVNLVISLGPAGAGGLPPDPAGVAPPNNPTEATLIGSSTEFLYTGANAIQTGVAAGTIQARRAAVVRGRVLDRNNQPLSGVTVSIKNHPELGQTLSRVNGWFDLAVNGGSLLTVDYQKAGFLPVQRQIDVPWQDFAVADDIVMIGLDTQVTAVTLGAGQAVQVARGTPASDADGTRQATILFPPGVTANMTMPNGSSQALGTLNVRATEYTVGDNGPEAMPGALPPSSGYTYAVEFSVDEAIAAGATRVDFTQPLPTYVDNFLNFPVGGIVPAGWYDRVKNAWIPSANGRVIRVLSVGGDGRAALDIDGSGNPAGDAALTELGVTDDERRQLGTLYSAGKTLWRVPVTHFTPWDYNWPYAPPADARPPPNEPVKTDDVNNPRPKDSNQCPGCSVEAQSQTLGEQIAITGTPFSLHYRSDRAPGYKPGRTIQIPLITGAPPGSLRSVDLTISVAGQVHRETLAPAANLKRTFVWDGLDAYGRPYLGTAKADVNICYDYPARPVQAANFARSFAQFSGTGTAIGRGRGPSSIVLCKGWSATVASAGLPKSNDLGLWTLDIQHAYVPNRPLLSLGDGGRSGAMSSQAGDMIISTVAGGGASGFSSDGGPATSGALDQPTAVAVGPDGSLYVAEVNRSRIRRISPDGIISTAAGSGAFGFSGDGGPATSAALGGPVDVAFGPDGSLYIAEASNHRIRRVGPDGIISSVAGNGVRGFSGDGGPATSATLDSPRSVALGSDGSLYIADTNNHRIRRVGPDGIIGTAVGTGIDAFSGDGGPATSAALNFGGGLALGPDGSLYIADGTRVRRVGSDGIIRTVAGAGSTRGGDGGPATSAGLVANDLVFGPDGSLYIADFNNGRIRQIGLDGNISTAAGTGVDGFRGDGGPATSATLEYPISVAVGPDGSLYVVDSRDDRVRRIGSSYPGFQSGDVFIGAAAGSQAFHFNSGGRHLDTRDTLTGTILHSFGYNTDGQLITITDRDGAVTRIERAGNGTPQAIISPDGQRTVLAFSADGYLAAVTNPAGEATAISYGAGGLMSAFTDARGNVDQFQYDSNGRLTKNTNAIGGGWTLAHVESGNGHINTLTSGENRSTAFAVEPLGTGDRRQTNTYPDGTKQQILFKTNGEQITTAADGTVSSVKEGPDPRFNMQSPVPNATTVTTPGGLTLSMGSQRAAVLSTVGDPFSLTQLTETLTLNGRAYSSVYESATRTYTDTTPAGRKTTTVINNKSRPVQTKTEGLNAAVYSYDARGRLQSLVVGSGAEARTTSFTYHDTGAQNGYLASMTDAESHTISFAYDAAGRTTTQTLADARVVQFGYDSVGNLSALTPPGRPAHQFTHTAEDQVQSYAPPTVAGTGSTTYQYDLDKGLTQLTQPTNLSLTSTYDSAGRQSSFSYPEGAIQYSYAPSTGKLAGITAPVGETLAFSYDGALLTRTVFGGSVTGSVDYSYDNDFRLTSVQLNGASPVTNTYDADSLLTGVAHAGGSLTLTRNAQNGLLAGTAIGQINDSYTYNGFGEALTYLARFDTTNLFRNEFTRDKLGRITQKVETIGGTTTTYNYGYDTTGRLVEVRGNGAVLQSYGYDSNGNRTQLNGALVGVYDNQDRLLSYNGASYTYSPNGELKTKTQGANTTSYRYDALGNLRAVTLPAGTQIEYLVDGLNRRIGKKVNGARVQGFIYQNQLRLEAELDGSGNVVSRFIYATGINAPDFMVKGGVTYRLIKDHLGSPRLVVNTTTNNIAQRLDYDAWGNVTQDSSPGFQPFGYAGGLYDRDTGLVRFGARDYDPVVGRWTAKDPIGFDGGDANLYGYVLNDPVNGSDPQGLVFPIIAAAAVRAVAVAAECAVNRLCRAIVATVAQQAVVRGANVVGAFCLRNEFACDFAQSVLEEGLKSLTGAEDPIPSPVTSIQGAIAKNSGQLCISAVSRVSAAVSAGPPPRKSLDEINIEILNRIGYPRLP